jgi:hypothetical protein
MPAMNYRLAICVLLFAVGCATVQPAKVKNGLYTNMEYEFAIIMPDGWELSETLPPILKQGMSGVASKKIKAIFSDIKNKRFIIVGAEKTQADWMSFSMYSDKFTTSLDQYYAQAKKQFLKSPEAKYYDYEIYKDNISDCPDKCITSKNEFQFGDLKSQGFNIAYLSKSGMVYAATLILVARKGQYETGLDTFKTVVDSFRHLND